MKNRRKKFESDFASDWSSIAFPNEVDGYFDVYWFFQRHYSDEIAMVACFENGKNFLIEARVFSFHVTYEYGLEEYNGPKAIGVFKAVESNYEKWAKAGTVLDHLHEGMEHYSISTVSSQIDYVGLPPKITCLSDGQLDQSTLVTIVSGERPN